MKIPGASGQRIGRHVISLNPFLKPLEFFISRRGRMEDSKLVLELERKTRSLLRLPSGTMGPSHLSFLEESI